VGRWTAHGPSWRSSIQLSHIYWRLSALLASHQVTKSSLLGICNATTVEPFTSGRLNKSATFEHVVGDSTDPTFVFCGAFFPALTTGRGFSGV
jgi:hypothetical protein